MSRLTKAEMEALQRKHGHHAWAYALQLREQRGEKLNLAQIRCYRNALGLNIPNV